MTHGRFGNPVAGALAGVRDLFAGETLAGRYDDGLRIDGRTCLVTGASSGLGRAVARDLAARGARVLMVSRSGIPEEGEAIRRATGNAAVEQIHCDLSDLDQVHQLADSLRERGERIDVLVENAGVATPRARRTAQGLDAMFVTNFLAKTVLIRRLLDDGTLANVTFAGSDPVPAGQRPRIVIVSSDSHRGASAIDWETLGRYADYGVNTGIANYSYFKLVLNTWACELSRRLAPGGDIDVPVHVVCPGPVNSNIARDAPPVLHVILKGIFTVFFRAPEKAARPVVVLCADPEFGRETGRYLHMLDPKRMDEKCYDAAAGRRLWERAAMLAAASRRAV